ncbi:hypothetical protein NARC_100013 [Candidatus Nitrosocosmicus arcticus]|uniref:Uncharacterized protein n=1 Tax=Candidatus Nitrosocosmicus arcticus TaxID=2035267 RepID=A0A557STL5_9ARCH|nr:hypothetical protein NARC_100013 [Candidatus Nitrosocosmicus arcticus]
MGTSELESNRINALSIVIKENTERFFSKNFKVISLIIISMGIKAF